MKIILKVYVVKNQEGKFFRAKGFSEYRQTWVDDIGKAKIYPKIGQARSRCTWFFNNYPKFGVPNIVELQVTNQVVLDETSRVEKSLQKKELAEIKRVKREQEYKLQQLKIELEKNQAEYKRLKDLEASNGL